MQMQQHAEAELSELTLWLQLTKERAGNCITHMVPGASKEHSNCRWQRKRQLYLHVPAGLYINLPRSIRVHLDVYAHAPAAQFAVAAANSEHDNKLFAGS